MVYLISFFLIVVEVSLPLTANMYGVTLPFLTYLVSLKKEKEIGLVILVILIRSLQTNNFFEILIILLLGYYLFHYLFTHLTYGKANIILISLLQLGVYAALSINRLKKEHVIANICSFIVLNFIYVKISKKRENIKG